MIENLDLVSSGKEISPRRHRVTKKKYLPLRAGGRDFTIPQRSADGIPKGGDHVFDGAGSGTKFMKKRKKSFLKKKDWRFARNEKGEIATLTGERFARNDRYRVMKKRYHH